MNRIVKLAIITILLVSGGYLPEAYAVREAKPVKVDHRVRTVMYQPDQVFRFVGHYGFQSSIEFEDGEEISTISMGDTTGWLMNPLGSRLFLKPIDRDATTNMTVLTNKRSYLFELNAREATDINDEEMVFVYRFVYPDTVDNVTVRHYMDSVPLGDFEENPENYNYHYTISGPDRIAPIRIFDDGEFTYFEFRDINADIPAFFLVDSQGNEAIINYRTRGNFIVVERVARRFTLRHGVDIVCVYNEGSVKPKLPDTEYKS